MSSPFVPRLYLFGDTVSVNDGDDVQPLYREDELALARLLFCYGSTAIPITDSRTQFFQSNGGAPRIVSRDVEGERQATRLLESFGAVDVGCAPALAALAEEEAHYLIAAVDEGDSLVHFGAVAVPALRARGWQIVIDTSYPCDVICGERVGEFVAQVATPPARQGAASGVGEATSEEEGWFNLRLGVEIDGELVDLLPGLVELLQSDPGALDLDHLARTTRPFVALPLTAGRLLAIAPARLAGMMEILVELYGGEQPGDWPALHVGCLAQLGEASQGEEPTLVLHGETQLLDRVRRLRGGEGETPVPRDLQATLRPYQSDGLAWLQGLRAAQLGGILADDMGLGKTLQTIAHLLVEWEAGRLDRPALIVCPTSLIGNWRRELGRFAPVLRILAVHGPVRHRLWSKVAEHDVVLTTYPLVHRDAEQWQVHAFHLVILDEAQVIKNPISRVSRAVDALRSRHRLCLSGTPLENRLTELWSLFNFANPGLLGDQRAFDRTFRLPIERDGSAGRLEALRRRVAPFILRRTKAAVAPELPAKTEMVRPIELSGDQRDLYEGIRLSAHEEVRRAIRTKGVGQATIDILGALLKLRQVCCDPRLVKLDAARTVATSAKLNALMRMLEEMLAQGRRPLIFSQFTSMLALITERLTVAGVPFATLTGSTRDRDREVERFESGAAQVFLLSLKAGGTGLNLTSADTVIHYDPWWNPAVQAQATDRAYRIGQKNAVFVYNLIVAGSVEERIVALQDRKRHLAETVLAQSPGDSHWSQTDIDDLFAPLASAPS